MFQSKLIEQIENEWAESTGFLGKLRIGEFDGDGLHRLCDSLSKISPDESDRFDRRLISLTWYIPMFMTWQRERVLARGGNIEELEQAINRVQSILENLLGVP